MPKLFLSRWNAIPPPFKWAMVILLALAMRLLLLWLIKWNNPTGDEAIVGLLAKHIAEGRDLPVFIYGQSYYGVLEAYLNAILFLIAGFSPNLIFILPLLFSLGLIGAEYLYARALFDSRTAKFSALVIALGPGLLLYTTLSADGGFALALLLQLIALWLFVLLYFRQTYAAPPFLAFCFVSGLACWVWQIYIPIFVVLLVLLVLRHVRPTWRDVILGAGLFFLASSPLWLYNLQTGGATFAQGFAKVTSSGAQTNLGSALQATLAERIAHWRTYLLIWAKAPGGANPILSLLIVLGILATWRDSHVQAHDFPAQARDVQVQTHRWFLQLSPAAFTLVLAALYFLIGSAALEYLMILLPLLLPLALRGWQSWRRVPLTLIVAAMLLTNLYTVWTITRSNIRHPDWASVISQLQAQHLTYGYSDYWNAYPLIYLTGEKIIVSPRLLTYGGRRDDRYPAYTAQVERAPQLFVLAPDDSPDSLQVQQMATQGTPALPLHTLIIPHGIVYFPLTPADPLRQWLASLKPSR